MSQLEQLVEKLRQQQATELVLLPGTTPRYLSNKGWQVLESQELTPAQTQQVCLSLLSGEEKDVLAAKGAIQGSVFSKKGYSVSYDIQNTWSGYSAHFEVQKVGEKGPEGLQVPEVLRQASERRSGLLVLTGPRRSGKTSVMAALLKQLNQSSSALVMTFSEHPHFLMNSEAATLVHHSLANLSGPEEVLSRAHMADVLVIDSIRSKLAINVCLQAAEQGKLVIFSYESMSLETGLKRMVWNFEPELRPMISELLTKHLQVAAGLRLLEAQEEGQWSLASEIMVNTPEVAESLLAEDWKKIEELMRTRGEKTGMQTLNQSLLQLLLRRKIPLQAAYELSPKVEELHEMMEKVGV